MIIDILTLFPDFFQSPLTISMIKRAREKRLVTITCTNIRDFALDKHHQVDDYPYGGGAGMLMKPDVIQRAVDSINHQAARVIYMSPQGSLFNQKKAQALAAEKHLIILCGHYEGIDHRALVCADEEISIGDYVLTGGEIPALVLIDAVVRLLPGVLGDQTSAIEESFVKGLLEYPQYTRPRFWGDKSVPEVLLSGHHENIRKWRKKQSLLRTLLNRPELLLLKEYDQEEKQILQEILFDKENGE